MRRAIKQGTIRGVEYTLLKADGTEFPGELSTSILKDAAGNWVGHITIARDITKRKQAEKALRESEEWFRSIVENSQAGIMILDDAYRFAYVNDELCRISGHSRDELIGQDFRQFLDEGSKELVAGRYIRRQRGEEVPPRYEFNIIKKDGQKRRVEISSAVIKDSAGEVKTVAQLMDITERKRAEEALQAEKNKLQSVIDAMEYSLTIQDKDYNIIYQNEPSRIASGGDHIGEKCYRAYEGEEKVCDGCPVEKAFKDGKSHTSERRTVAPSGEVIFWENTANPIRDAGGKIIACLELARDITERKRAEEALQAEKNKLQSLIGAIEYGLSIQDREYNIIYQNEPLTRNYGDRLGEKCYRVYEGEEKLCDGCPVEKAFKDGKSHTVERKVVMPSGEVAFREVTANPIRDAEGEIVSCLEVIRNITKRKRMEEALADEATRRRILIDQSLDGIVVLDENAKVYEANQRFAEMLGYTLGEVRELHTWDWDKQFPPEKLLEMGRAVDEKGLHLETKHHRKDGSVIDVDISINGAVVAGQKLIFCVCRDITERKQAEEQLQESQKFSSSLLASSPNPITVVNLDTSIRYVNPAFEKLTGFSLDEIAGRKAPYPWWPQGKRRKILTAFKDAVEHGGRRTERNFQRKNGERFWVALNSAPVMQDGKPVYLIISWLDITERKQTEEALQAEKNKLQSLVDAMEYGITIQDKDYNIIYEGKLVETLFGDRRGEKCYRVYEGKEKLCDGCPVEKAFKDGESHTSERRVVMPSGEVNFWENTANPIRDAEGEIVSCLEVVRNITERKQAEEKEKQLQQELYLAQRLASVGELAAGVAHEINNPLTGVLGFSQRLMRKSTDEKVSRDLEIIHNEAQRAADVVQSLLTFARRRQSKKEYANINDVVNKALELRAYALQTGNIEVVTTLAPRLPQIMVDFAQMQEVFLNIILNAEQAMSEAHGKGKLVIKTSRIKGYVRISFADDGPGIPPENLDKVFDPFFTTREEKGGTGLGLSACHGIVTEHGGRIYARSKPGRGATFFVELPLSPAEATAGRRA
jgi:PAS domain S-box-containing protein